jgi:GT2 family glycosyltransferase
MLIIVDNASTDGTGAMLDAIDDSNILIIRNNRNVGVAAANNQGIEEGMRRGATRIVVSNNDTEFEPDLLARLDQSLCDNDASAVSPLIPYYDHPDQIWFGGGHFSRRRGVRVVHDHERAPLTAVGDVPFFIDYAPTCCVMFDAAAFERIGLMDERYFVYWDDVDFMWRMKQAGLRLILDPTIRLLHKVSISTGGRLSDFSIKYNFRNQIFYTRKFHGMLWSSYTAFMAMLSGAALLVIKGDRPRHLYLRAKALRQGFAMPRP